ncbi:MAG: MgtC/SapB family protein [Bacilli bacterium]|nr:MgtC/SapB family protein [Bacilli bacterium]
MNLFNTFSVTTIDQNIADLFNNNFGLGGDWSWGNLILCIIAIILTVALTGCIGYEREKKGRTAGLRTHIIVGVGSCIIMIISIYGFPQFGATRDVARLAAGIVTGVGFLGAGTIIHNNGGIKGLTTASTIWLAMAIGMACGSMNFLLAIAAGIVVLMVLVFFRKFEVRITRSSAFVIVSYKSDAPVMKDILGIATRLDCDVEIVSTEIVNKNGEELLDVSFKLINKNNLPIDTELFKKELFATSKVINIETPNMH